MLIRLLIRLLFPDLQRQVADAPSVQVGIASEMIDRSDVEDRAPVEDIDRIPSPPTRPHDRAQWDEAAGRWIEWDATDHEWDPVDRADHERPPSPSDPT